jgi:hypothetical protein
MKIQLPEGATHQQRRVADDRSLRVNAHLGYRIDRHEPLWKRLCGKAATTASR